MASFASAHVFRVGVAVVAVVAADLVANARGGGMRDITRRALADELVVSSAGNSLRRDSRSRALSVFNMRLYSPTDRSVGLAGDSAADADASSLAADTTGFGFGGKPGRDDNPSDGVGETRGSGGGGVGGGGGGRGGGGAAGLRRARAVVHPASDASSSSSSSRLSRSSRRAIVSSLESIDRIVVVVAFTVDDSVDVALSIAG